AGTPVSAVRPPRQRYYVVDVSFGPVGRPTRRTNIPRLLPLPATGRPALLFFGVFNGGSSAGFLVSRHAAVLTSNCLGRPRDCGLMRLRHGRSARLAVRGADGRVRGYRLKVLRIHKVVTRDARAAARARARVSHAGRCILAADGNAFGSVLLDPTDGTYRSVTPGAGSCRDTRADGARAASAFAPIRTLDSR
ncbi:MAG: hypothetical protein M3296_09270, partial [Actinomycetota bacterium]|nr:hypothetical protein [Actinomycetota bacterium]